MKYDIFSFEYYAKHVKKIGKKNYLCEHEGYCYCNGMKFDRMEIIYDNGQECNIIASSEKGKNKNSTKHLYIGFLEKIDVFVPGTLKSFNKSSKAQKYRIYTFQEYENLNKKQKDTLRVDNCKIVVDEKEYYVANNLNFSEFIKNISDHIPKDEKKNIYLKTYAPILDLNQSLVDRNEMEEISEIDLNNEIVLNVVADIVDENKHSNVKKNSIKRETYVVDFTKVNKKRITKGCMGEQIVYNYERERLKKIGKQELANNVRIVSENSKLGYDIVSYSEEGKEIYIEVKTSSERYVDGFYISANELKMAEELSDKYYIYRIYNLDMKEMTADLYIYKPPFDRESFLLETTSYFVKMK